MLAKSYKTDAKEVLYEASYEAKYVTLWLDFVIFLIFAGQKLLNFQMRLQVMVHSAAYKYTTQKRACVTTIHSHNRDQQSVQG